MDYEAIIGLEAHVELNTNSKMFCGCRVVDSTTSEPNCHVCPVCSGMPGALPTINKRAVDLGILVALALNCKIESVSLFARKNYFYPDLPKGYQISQYEKPLATNGYINVEDAQAITKVRIRRVHLEEDTGKLVHINGNGNPNNASLIDLNRAGVPLLEIVSEPDMRSSLEVISYAKELHSVLTYLGVNNGDMEKGVLRFEANVSVRESGSKQLNDRREIKNLNSFRSLQRSINYEIKQQITAYKSNEPILQQTLGWNESNGTTVFQRSKEHSHDYRYFPEPDLPPLNVDATWKNSILSNMPELPHIKRSRFLSLGLTDYDARVLAAQRSIAEYFELAVKLGAEKIPPVLPKPIANWITTHLFSIINEVGKSIDQINLPPSHLVDLIDFVISGKTNTNGAKLVLWEMCNTGVEPETIITRLDLEQTNDQAIISKAVDQVLASNPDQVTKLLDGKESIVNWLFGQVMQSMDGKSNSDVVRTTLQAAIKRSSSTRDK
jgi:aspartyl-tRNA(Asn)/glutamyl-tRNA(Gln) amidotransferase subunit B